MLPNIKDKTSKGYRKLILYQKSKELVLLIYKLTKDFPKEEQFVTIPQIRRATLSIVANLVEGYSKNSRKEFIRFLDISIGSSTELEVFLEISYELGYINDKNFVIIDNLHEEVRKLLYSYQWSLRQSQRVEESKSVS